MLVGDKLGASSSELLSNLCSIAWRSRSEPLSKRLFVEDGEEAMPMITRLQWRFGVVASLVLGPFLTSPAASQEHVHKLERLGKVEFKVECNDAAQHEFNRAMALYHSFAWTPAGESFLAVPTAD